MVFNFLRLKSDPKIDLNKCLFNDALDAGLQKA